MSKIIVRYGQNMTEEILKIIKEFESKHIKSCCKGNGVLELISRFNGPLGSTQFAKCFICNEQIELDNSDLL